MTVIDTLGPGGRQQVEALSTPPTLTMLLALGEGPIAAIRHRHVLRSMANRLPIFPACSFTGRAGTPDQTPIPEFGETANTFSDGRQIGD